LNHFGEVTRSFRQSDQPEKSAMKKGIDCLKTLATEGERGFVDVTEATGIYSSILGVWIGNWGG